MTKIFVILCYSFAFWLQTMASSVLETCGDFLKSFVLDQVNEENHENVQLIQVHLENGWHVCCFSCELWILCSYLTASIHVRWTVHFSNFQLHNMTISRHSSNSYSSTNYHSHQPLLLSLTLTSKPTFSHIFPTLAFLFFLRTDSTDSCCYRFVWPYLLFCF